MTTARENYLKAIYDLSGRGKPVLVSQIAGQLGVTRVSVSQMIKTLEQDGLVQHERYGPLTLTEHGVKIARSINKRNKMIVEFLVDVLGMDVDTAKKDACRMEHTISNVTANQLARYLHTEKMKTS